MDASCARSCCLFARRWRFRFGTISILAPRSAYALDQLQNSLKSSQAAFEIQPRVFYEDFSNYVLYVEGVQAKGGHAVWNNVLLADLTEPQSPS